MTHRKWEIFSQIVFALFYRLSMSPSLGFRLAPFNLVHVLSETINRVKQVTWLVNYTYYWDHVNNNLIFQILLCKSTLFEETPFATSSGATGNHVKVYDTCTIKHVKYDIYFKIFWVSLLKQIYSYGLQARSMS